MISHGHRRGKESCDVLFIDTTDRREVFFVPLLITTDFDMDIDGMVLLCFRKKAPQIRLTTKHQPASSSPTSEVLMEALIRVGSRSCDQRVTDPYSTNLVIARSLRWLNEEQNRIVELSIIEAP